MKPKILFISSNSKITLPYLKALQEQRFSVVENSSTSIKGRSPQMDEFDLVISLWETKLFGSQFSEASAPIIDGVFLTRSNAATRAIRTFQNGVYNFCGPKIDIDKFLGTVRELLADCNEPAKSNESKDDDDRGRKAVDAIIGQSPQIVELRKLIRKISQHPFLPILITGETGTGKELVADALHACSIYADKPFVKINCSAIPDNLLESTLFGHIRGAFTGADIMQKGLVEEADGGALFLDEIGDMSPCLQPKLLRFLEGGTFRRVGENLERQVKTWIISATNRDMAEENHNDILRSDLLYRLRGVELHLPSLRDHPADILLLTEHFLTHSNRLTPKPSRKFPSPDVKEIFLQYSWPGNVRELKHLIEQIAINGEEDEIGVDDLPSSMLALIKKGESYQEPIQTLREIEQRYIREVLKLTDRQIRKTAKLLGIDRNTLRKKIRDHGIDLT